MGPMIKFLQAVRNLSKQGVKKDDIYNAAKREFGEMSELLKRQIDDIYDRFKKPASGTKKEGDVIDFPDARKNPVNPFDEILDETKETSKVLKGEEVGEKNLETFIKSDEEREFLGFPSRGQEALVRAAAREVLSKAGFGFRIGKQDPIQMARQIFGDEVLFALDNITDQLAEVGSMPQLTKVLDETGILEKFAKPREGLNVEKKGEIEDLTKFDTEGREPNQSGGLAGILGV